MFKIEVVTRFVNTFLIKFTGNVVLEGNGCVYPLV